MKNQTLNKSPLLIFFAVSCNLAVAGLAAATDEVKLFSAPPTPFELAEILFPRTRSIVIEDGSDTRSQPERAFGMHIHFEFGQATIVPESKPYLDSLGEMLNLTGLSREAIVIEGHTDAVGSESYNQVLSEKRALAIKQYLIKVHSISADRLYPVGKGEQELLNQQIPDNPLNRRVQFRPFERGAQGQN